MVEVRIGECSCPGTPHGEGDVVLLPATANTSIGVAAERAISRWVERWPLRDRQSPEAGDDLQQRLIVAFVRSAPVGWNLVDEKGKPVPFDVDSIVNDWRRSREVADRASDLYTDAVLAPFLPSPAARSPSGPTDATTSAPPTPIRKPRERSSRATSAASRRSTA